MSHTNQETAAREYMQSSVDTPDWRDDKKSATPTDGTRPGPLSEATLLGRKTRAIPQSTVTPPVEATRGEYRALAGLLLERVRHLY